MSVGRWCTIGYISQALGNRHRQGPDWSALTWVHLRSLSCDYRGGVLQLIAGRGACGVQCAVGCHIGAVGRGRVILSVLILPERRV